MAVQPRGLYGSNPLTCDIRAAGPVTVNQLHDACYGTDPAYMASFTTENAARDMDAVKSLWPKGVQVARENLERSIGATQEVLGNAMNANESIGQIAKGQFESATAQAKAEVEKATKAAGKAAN